MFSKLVAEDKYEKACCIMLDDWSYEAFDKRSRHSFAKYMESNDIKINDYCLSYLKLTASHDRSYINELECDPIMYLAYDFEFLNEDMFVIYIKNSSNWASKIDNELAIKILNILRKKDDSEYRLLGLNFFHKFYSQTNNFNNFNKQFFKEIMSYFALDKNSVCLRSPKFFDILSSFEPVVDSITFDNYCKMNEVVKADYAKNCIKNGFSNSIKFIVSNGYSKIAEGIRIILSSHDNNKFKSGMIDALTSGKFRKFTDELILLIQNKRKEFVNYKEAFENQVLSKTDWIGRTLTDFELADIQSQIIKVDKIISELDLALDRNSKIPSFGAKKKRT
jgi:hypothetical protein